MSGRELHSSINQHGGIDILVSHFSEIKIWDKIDTWLGTRHARAEYSYGDAVQTWVTNMLAGSKRLEHSSSHKDNFQAHPKFQKGMSPDTISRTLRDLAVDNTYYTKLEGSYYKKTQVNKLVLNPNKKEIESLHEINVNPKLNSMLLDTAISLGVLKVGESYELDIDATILHTKVSDARTHYKRNGRGYCPMVVLLGGIPIYIEMRNGNSSPAFRKQEVLQATIELVRSCGIDVKFVRIDAAGSSKKVIDYLSDLDILFYIRAADNKRTQDKKVNWVRSEKQPHLDIADKTYTSENHSFLIVEYKNSEVNDKDGNPKIFAVITNDFEISQEDVIGVYNQRGAMEHRFADLKEIGWHYMVHRELKFNAVHVQMTMLAYIFFIYSKKWLANKVDFIKENIKPKTFIKKFVEVVTMWAGTELCFLNRQKEFVALRGGT